MHTLFHSPLLVVEDDPNTRTLIELAFRQDNYHIHFAQNGTEAESYLQKTPPELMICDVMLPDAHGLDLCRLAKAKNPLCQILILTSMADTIDKVLGLEAGADDYITKPFDGPELRARVRAAIRRLNSRQEDVSVLKSEVSFPRAAETNEVLELGELKISRIHHRVWRQNMLVDLTPKEFELLEILAATPGKAFTREELMATLWPETSISIQTLNSTVRRLREKLDEPFAASPLIQSIRGIGYSLRVYVQS